MANYFSNMDESPQWIPSSGFFPDDGYSSPRSSIESSVTVPNSHNNNSQSEEELTERQKFIMAQEYDKGDNTDYLKSKLWWLGITLMILGEVGNFVGKSIENISQTQAN